jgi:hypothetical protein
MTYARKPVRPTVFGVDSCIGEGCTVSILEQPDEWAFRRFRIKNDGPPALPDVLALSRDRFHSLFIVQTLAPEVLPQLRIIPEK